MDRLRVGIQFLGRNFGDTGNDQVIIDWAYGDYRWRDQLGFRAGKVKLPFGLYNEGRDVDMLRTSIFLPQSIYNEKQRDFILAYEGAGVYGNFDLQGGGELDYHVYGGTLNVPDATAGFWRDLFAKVGQDARPRWLGFWSTGNTATPTGRPRLLVRSIDDPEVSFPWIFGGALTWNTPLDGFRLGLHGHARAATISRPSCVTMLTFPKGITARGTIPSCIEIDETDEINYLATFSAEYVRDDWNLAAEYYRTRFKSAKSTRLVCPVGLPVLPPAFPVVPTTRTCSPLEGDQEKEELESLGLPDYYAWQRDLTISSRFDLTDFWLFKLEYHFIDGVAVTEPRAVGGDLADPKSRNWGMFAAKTTFHF